MKKDAVPDELISLHSSRCITPHGLVFFAGGIIESRNAVNYEAGLFDPVSIQITPLPNIKYFTYNAAAVCSFYEIYLIGGEGTDEWMQFLDISTNKWITGDIPIDAEKPITWMMGE